MPKKSNNQTAVPRWITGRDLHVIRVHAKLGTPEMAKKLDLKSRKTISNWEQQNSQPNINVFIKLCAYAGFNPSLVIAEIIKRNSEDPTQKRFLNLRRCQDKGAKCLARISSMKMTAKPFKRHQYHKRQ